MAAQFAIATDIRSTINVDGGILLNIKSGVVYSLSGTGAKIWSLLQESEYGVTFDFLLSGLARHYDAPLLQLRTDLEDFLSQLEQKGLVHKVEAREAGARWLS